MHELNYAIRAKFDEGVPVAEAAKQIMALYTEIPIHRSTVYRSYDRLSAAKEGARDRNSPGVGNPELDARLLNLLSSNEYRSTRELAKEWKVGKSIVARRLHALGYSAKWNTWLPFELTPLHEAKRRDVSKMLLDKEIATPFLDDLITTDETWIFLKNRGRKQGWSRKGERLTTPKPDKHGKKVMLSIFWCSRGILFYQLLRRNKHVNADVYCQQLTHVAQAVRRNRLGFSPQHRPFLLQDNARPHTAKMTTEHLRKLRFNVLPHPPYSPDMSPSDFYLFRDLKAHIKEKSFENEDEVKNELHTFFASKPVSYWEKGIHKLKKRWRKIISLNGKYYSSE